MVKKANIDFGPTALAAMNGGFDRTVPGLSTIGWARARHYLRVLMICEEGVQRAVGDRVRPHVQAAAEITGVSADSYKQIAGHYLLVWAEEVRDWLLQDAEARPLLEVIEPDEGWNGALDEGNDPWKLAAAICFAIGKLTGELRESGDAPGRPDENDFIHPTARAAGIKPRSLIRECDRDLPPGMNEEDWIGICDRMRLLDAAEAVFCRTRRLRDDGVLDHAGADVGVSGEDYAHAANHLMVTWADETRMWLMTDKDASPLREALHPWTDWLEILQEPRPPHQVLYAIEEAVARLRGEVDLDACRVPAGDPADAAREESAV